MHISRSRSRLLSQYPSVDSGHPVRRGVPGRKGLLLLHLVADYGPGDLAAAEVRARLAVHLPGAEVMYTPVGPFDTVAAGFCVAQLALGEGPAERLVYHNVAPREDVEDSRPDNEGEPLLVARLSNGGFVAGVGAGSTFAFVAEEVVQLHEVAVPSSGSQFRSRDAFPLCCPACWPVTGPCSPRRWIRRDCRRFQRGP